MRFYYSFWSNNSDNTKVIEKIICLILNKAKIILELPKISKYLFDISQYILIPLYSYVRLFVYVFDVIHTLGIYSWGVKIDAIPGRINVATTLRLLNKGEYRGKCFELCGQGHLSTAIVGLVYDYID